MAQPAMYEQMVFPTRFVWAYGGKQVHLCGSFTNWLETVPMAIEPNPTGGEVFAVVCNLPPGYHQYKFIVDGEWRHDENQAFIQDPLGNVNNWLFVKKPGAANEPSPGQGIPIPQPREGGAGGGMDWIGSSMGGLQIKRNSEGVIKQPGPASSLAPSAMGIKGIAGVSDGDQDTSRARVLEFLQRHTAYELIPESNKVVVLDTKLPVRQAFHACHEQGIMAAPLWDERAQEFVGMLSAGDFMDIVRVIGPSLASSAMSEAQLDQHTIAMVREEKAAETGTSPAPLVSVRPEDSLHLVTLTLMQGRLAMAPVLSYGSHPPRGQTPTAQLLHLTNLAEVFACLVRHFRGVPSALPLFSQPIGALPIGTWTAALDASASQSTPIPGLLPVKAILPSSTVEDAFKMMPGCGALPVVDEAGRLVDVYARADVILLAAENTYRRVSLSEFTVAQALQRALPTPRAHTCTRGDTLRAVVEALSLPGVRRLVVVDANSHAVEGVVSLSDVAAFLLQT
ncbi:carbohydrate-binding module family 48 protein [Micromonas pusilla CCMP1545]|uniref:Carbohydrate-binding module family 48 protein n=1 Tax=Micromonas pusilla (strain CCMP1545) TaxID=564608 RepID=C1MQF1_MICPC|nr:carbohydrate-binding module family 48 protein [Micromonas pusilla CCMP1545]EEH58068.1 carbohydrate-binding module family 48 protein [Micromonas pusilla CCMP1545]|eukprot:XP_003058117.1 carbohydrate-binding module family 48 protein [Micromonas pusilla CCMP1545]